MAVPSLGLRGRKNWLIAGAGARDPGGVRLACVGGCRLELGLCWEFVSGGTRGQELCVPGHR